MLDNDVYAARQPEKTGTRLTRIAELFLLPIES